MLNPNELTVGISRNAKLLRTALFALIMVLAGIRFYEGFQAQRTPIIILGLALGALAIFAVSQIWRYKVTLTDGYIEVQNIFSSKRLLYSDVYQVRERKRHLLLIGSTETLRIAPDLESRDQVFAKLASRLNALPVLRVSGVSSRWQLADRDEEGRLVRP